MRQRSPKRRQKKQAVFRFQSEFTRSGVPKLTFMQRLRRGIIFTVVLVTGAAVCSFLLFARLQVEGAPESIAGSIENNGETVFLPAFDSEALVKELKSDYRQEVAGVSLSHQWWARSLTVKVELRSASLVLRTRGRDYSVDKEGAVIGGSEDSENSLPLLVDRSNLETEAGKQAIPQRLVGFITRLDRNGLDIRQFHITDTTSEVYAELTDGYMVRFATGKSLEIQLENLKRVQAKANEKGDVIDEYVDLRIPYKAYYR